MKSKVTKKVNKSLDQLTDAIFPPLTLSTQPLSPLKPPSPPHRPHHQPFFPLSPQKTVSKPLGALTLGGSDFAFFHILRYNNPSLTP